MIKSFSPYDPKQRYLKPEEALKYLIEVLIFSSPRMAIRCKQELDLFYNAFISDDKTPVDSNDIKLCDLLALSLIRIKYPFVIDFIKEVVSYATERHGIRWYLFTEQLKKQETSIENLIFKTTGREIKDEEKEDIKNLLYIAFHQLAKIEIGSADYGEREEYMDGRTSDWLTMKRYLSVTAGDIDPSRFYYDLYKQHQNDRLDLIRLGNEQLLEYSSNFRNIDTSEQKIHIEIADEILNRITDQRIKVTPKNMSETVGQTASYQLVFQILNIIEKNRGRKAIGKKKAFTLFENILKLKTVGTGWKYIVLNSLANNKRGSGSEIHIRLSHAFEQIKEYKLQETLALIQHVFEEADQRYFKGKRIIYELEENFFYTLFQGWSGNPNNKKEIDLIRRAAKRSLLKHPDAIQLYWSRFPHKEQWKDVDDFFNDNEFFPSDSNFAVYMPLNDLIKITKKVKLEDAKINAKMSFWSLVEKDVRYQQLSTIQADNQTLKGVMIERGFVQNSDQLWI